MALETIRESKAEFALGPGRRKLRLMQPYSLFSPLPHLTLLQLLLWPWIYAQAMRLKRSIRARYGRGVPYRWVITDCCQVILIDAPFLPFDTGGAQAALHLRTEVRARSQIAPASPRLVRAQSAFAIQTLGARLAASADADAVIDHISNPVFVQTGEALCNHRIDSS